jgi:hypothetical protein
LFVSIRESGGKKTGEKKQERGKRITPAKIVYSLKIRQFLINKFFV